MEVDVILDAESPEVDVEVANRIVTEIKPVLHDNTINGDGIDTPMGVNTEVIATKEDLTGKADKTDIPDVSGFATKEDISEFATQDALNDFVTREEYQTTTAYFRGNWATWADVPSDPELYPADVRGNHAPTANDYMVIIADERKNGGTWRYKYTGAWATRGKDGWQAEYQVNETPLTAAQLAALNSGVTAQAVEDIKNKQDKLVAGDGITINGNTISASGGGVSLPDQTDNAGKFLQTDGENVSWGDALENYATQEDSIGIGTGTIKKSNSVNIGINAISGDSYSSNGNNVAIGYNAKAANGPFAARAVAIGSGAKAQGSASIAIGYNSNTQAAESIAIGGSASANSYSIAIGTGANASEDYSFFVGLKNPDISTIYTQNYKLLSKDGLIPTDRFTTTPTGAGTYIPKLTIAEDGTATREWAADQIGDISTALTAILGE